MKNTLGIALLLSLAVAIAPGCGKKKEKKADQKPDTSKPGTDTAKTPAADTPGVDMAKKVVSVGMLNDESGPGAAIGKPFANGLRLLVKRINAGGSGILPDGWTIKLVEKDHGYNPQQSVQHYNAIKNDILFLGSSFGTPNTLPLRKSLERDDIIAFPASLSSLMAEHEHTPPLAASYKVEAIRALDWIVEKAGGADKVKVGIVYQEDDYGKDGLEGLRMAAEHHKVKIVAEKTVAPGQKDVTAVIGALKDAGANHVLLTVLPSSTGPLLGTAAQLKYMPTWVGNTPSWIDRFFSKDVIPPAVFTNFYMVTSLPFWGEKSKGMDDFLATWEEHGKDMGAPDSYILMSYLGGIVQMQALKRAIEGGDVSREGYKKALHSITNWTADGLAQPVDFSKVPYEVSTKTRILKPVIDKKTWEVVADFADPSIAAGASAPAEAPPTVGDDPAEAGDDEKDDDKKAEPAKEK